MVSFKLKDPGHDCHPGHGDKGIQDVTTKIQVTRNPHPWPVNPGHESRTRVKTSIKATGEDIQVSRLLAGYPSRSPGRRWPYPGHQEEDIQTTPEFVIKWKVERHNNPLNESWIVKRHNNPLVIHIDSKEQKKTDEKQGPRIITMIDLNCIYSLCT